MIAFASLLSPRQIAARLSWLPCAGPCGRKGPHPTYAAPAGGTFALCERCRLLVSEEGQRVGGEVADQEPHGATLPAPPALA